MTRLCSSRYEREARKLGWTRIAGLDEVGRGSLFGPVVAAAVILNPKRRIVGLDDSKQIAAERREVLADAYQRTAVAWAVAEIDAQRIDAWNIYQASRQAMTAALQQLAIAARLLVDRRHAARRADRAEIVDQGRRALCVHRGCIDSRKNPPRHAHAGIGRRLSSIWFGATQGLCHAGTPRSAAKARRLAAAPLFVRSRARRRLLGRPGRSRSTFFPTRFRSKYPPKSSEAGPGTSTNRCR